MYIETTLILFSAVLIPLIFRKNENSAKISFFIIFLFWAFQYDMAIDYSGHIDRWLVSIGKLPEGDRPLEFCYKYLLKICQPLTFFGFTIINSAIQIYVLYLYLKKYIKPGYEWIMFAIFCLNLSYCVMFYNCQRQMIAMTYILVAIYLMTNKANLVWNSKYAIISYLLFIVAYNTHRSAIIAFPMLFFPFLITKITSNKYLYIFLILNILSYFVNLSPVSAYLETYMSTNDSFEGFAAYASEVSQRGKSVIQQGYFTLFLFLFICNFSKFKHFEKPIVLSAILYLSLQGFAMHTMLRVLYYYQIMYMFALPILCSHYMKDEKKSIAVISRYFIVSYLFYLVYRYFEDINGPNFQGYQTFQTIFSAPQWL